MKKNPPQEDRPDSPRGYVKLGDVHVKAAGPAKLDAKFYAAVHKVKDGISVPDDEWMIFLAKDNAFPATLLFYRDECHRLGADEEHLQSVERTMKRLKEWREANPDRCKVPDAKGEKLLG